MLIFIYCADRAGAGAVRERARLQHLEYMVANTDKLVFGGLLPASPGERGISSIFVLELPTMDAAEDFLAGEPYNQAGLFDSVEIRAFQQMWPEPEPGTLKRALRRERER